MCTPEELVATLPLRTTITPAAGLGPALETGTYELQQVRRRPRTEASARTPTA
jgi:hypothetical protein